MSPAHAKAMASIVLDHLSEEAGHQGSTEHLSKYRMTTSAQAKWDHSSVTEPLPRASAMTLKEARHQPRTSYVPIEQTARFEAWVTASEDEIAEEFMLASALVWSGSRQ